jgi:hypothetical protein
LEVNVSIIKIGQRLKMVSFSFCAKATAPIKSNMVARKYRMRWLFEKKKYDYLLV